jgi:hypothetical protein
MPIRSVMQCVLWCNVFDAVHRSVAINDIDTE